MALPSFLKRDGDSILFNNEDGFFAFYVPELYFGKNKNLAVITGDYINIFGILDYAICDGEGKWSELKPFKFPTVFLTQPREIEKIKNVKLTSYIEPQDYRVLKYFKDDAIIMSTKVPQDTQFIEDFYNLFLFGHLPTTIRYDEMQNYFIENITLNGGKYGNIPTQLIGVVISEMCRDPKDFSKPFRLGDMRDMTDYYAASIKEIPKLVSPFVSLTSENWDEGVMNAISMDQSKESPLETIFTR